MINEELKMKQTLEIISYPKLNKEQIDAILQEIREYRYSNPVLWDKIRKIFQK